MTNSAPTHFQREGGPTVTAAADDEPGSDKASRANAKSDAD